MCGVKLTMKCGIFIGLLACYIACVRSEGEHAHLLASKNILNQYIVENKDLTVEYVIYNVGESSAINVHLSDKSFPDADFEVAHGSLDVKWQRIVPSSNVSHIVILKPKRSGYFNFTAAELSYYPTESAKEPQLAYTSAPGEGGIVSFKEYDRKFSPHILDWLAFAVMTLPSLGIPFLLWRRSKSKYDSSRAKKD